MQAFWVLFATILASSMAFIDGSALNVALPAVQSGLSASAAQLLWVVTGYQLMLAALIPLGGALGDSLGRKRVYTAGIAGFVATSLACGLSPSIRVLIVARIVQGAASALMIPGSLAIITAYFPPKERGRAIGTWSAVTTVVTVIGPVLGGLLANAGLWRGVFFINVPLGAAALAALLARVPESRDERASGRIDYPGAALLALALAGLSWGFVSAPGRGFGDPLVWGALAAGVLLAAAFVLVESRSRSPMIPLGLFSSRTFTGTNLLTLFLYGALGAGTFFLSLDLVQAQGYSMAAAGFAFLPFAVFLTALSRWTGALADRHGPRPFLVVGPALAGAGFLLVGLAGLTAGPSRYWTTFLPGIACLGIGMGFTVAPLTTAVMTSVDTRFAGTASGINNAVSRTAGVLAVAVIGAVALIVLAGRLAATTADLPMPAAARAALQGQASRLGAAAVPPEVPAASASAAGEAIRLAFVHTIRVAMLACAGLCWLGALLAWLFVEARRAARAGLRRPQPGLSGSES
jgi:EmrB/QacA subfamily drug resistance transporter